ncbi:MAG: hypothetical protein ACTSRG_17430 [Candidatus Helarchaeota archaeon]
MPISLPDNYQEIIKLNPGRIEDIRANYNYLYELKEKELKKKFGTEFEKIIRTNRSHAILLSDFLKPFISNKKESKYKLLENYSLLLLDPLYSEGKERVPTFDALIGYTSGKSLNEIYFIEAKSKGVDDEYKEYEIYFNEDLIEIIQKKVKEQYPHLNFSKDMGVTIHILIYNRHSKSWIPSIKHTKKNVYIWSRVDENDAEKKFKLLWIPNNEEHMIQNIIDFFDQNLILKTTEFEMSYSLDNIYNLEVLRNNYINRFKDEPLDLKLSIDIFKKIAKSDYFEKKTIENNFYKELTKLGLEYDIIYKKDIIKSDLYFRKGEDLLKKKYIEKKLNENLNQNEHIKKKLLDDAINALS